MPRSILNSFSFNVGGNTITNHTAAVIPLTIKGAASQSANLLEIRNSSNTLLSYTLSNGDWVMPNLFNSYAGVGTGYSDYQGGATSLYVRPTATTRSGAVIKGLASQTADLLQMQDSTGAILAKVDSVGAFTTNSANGYSIAGAAAFKSLNSGQTMLLTAGASVNTNPHIVMRQSSSQTGDILQIQNSSGTILSRFDSGGNLKATNVATLNSIGQLAESNSGALFVMGRATAQASSPGLNTGTLYFRDGTTAGTLRLATRTGASGVEETIVDNISSTGSTAGARFTGAGGVNTAGNVVYHIETNARTANYTLVLADDGDVIEMNVASANTVTIPLNSSVAFPIGTQITVIQTGTGQTSIAVTSGVTLNATPITGTNNAKLRAQWSSLTLLKRGTDTWIAMGDLTA
jgi:hypothetical protein